MNSPMRRLGEESGASVIEYALLVAFIGLVAFAGSDLLTPAVSTQYNSACEGLTDNCLVDGAPVVPDPTPPPSPPPAEEPGPDPDPEPAVTFDSTRAQIDAWFSQGLLTHTDRTQLLNALRAAEDANTDAQRNNHLDRFVSQAEKVADATVRAELLGMAEALRP